MEPPAALLAAACGALDRLQACLANPAPEGLPAALDAADTVTGAVAELRERPDDAARPWRTFSGLVWPCLPVGIVSPR